MSALKRSFLAVGSLVAVASVMAGVPAAAQVASFDPRDFGSVELLQRQSASDADAFIARSGGAFEPIRALRADDEVRQAARSVGRVDVVMREEDGREVGITCTGTLLPHGYVLTNHHCIPATGPSTPVRALIMMNYLEQDSRDARRFDLSVTPVESDEKLDFSIVAIQGDASEFEGVQFSDAPVQPGQSLIVIHHPQGRPMVMTRFRCQAYTEQPDDIVLRHRCDTLPGSSGAMIFTSSLKGVALHFAGGLERGDDHSFNSSTRITAIFDASSTIRAGMASQGAAGAESRPLERHRTGAGGRQNPKQAAESGGRVDPNDILREEAPR